MRQQRTIFAGGYFAELAGWVSMVVDEIQMLALPFKCARQRCLKVAILILTLVPSITGLAQGNNIGLTLTADAPVIAPGATGTQTFTVLNSGGLPTTGPIQLTIATPSYTAFVAPLPTECNSIYTNADPSVPEVFACTIATPLNAGGSQSFSIPMAVSPFAPATSPIAPSVSTTGMAIVLPASGSLDVETDLINNITNQVVLISGNSTTTSSGPVNLTLTSDVPVLNGTGTSSQTFYVTNNGTGATASVSVVGIALPFFVKVNGALPSNCSFPSGSPSMPQIVVCTIAAGLTKASSPQSFTLSYGVAPTANGTFVVGSLEGIAAIETSSASDVDFDRRDNIYGPIVTILPPKYSAIEFGLSRSRSVSQTSSWNASRGGSLAVKRASNLAIGKTGKASAIHSEAVHASDPATSGALVDYNLVGENIVALPGSTASLTLTIGNSGQNPTGQVRLVAVSPPFVNFGNTLPSGCSFDYPNPVPPNPDATNPEIVDCTLTAPNHGQEVQISLPLVAANLAPQQQFWLNAIIVPASGSNDVEQDISDNFDGGSLTVEPGTTTSGSGMVDLYVNGGVNPNVLTNRRQARYLLSRTEVRRRHRGLHFLPHIPHFL